VASAGTKVISTRRRPLRGLDSPPHPPHAERGDAQHQHDPCPLHDIDLAETAAAGKPSRHGIVGARLFEEYGFSEAIVHAVEAHDDDAGVERARPIAHALYCADRAYWAIHSSGLRFPSEAATATPAFVVEELERRGITDRIDEALRRECDLLGLTLDDLLRVGLDVMRAMPEPEAGTPASATRRD